MDRETFKQPTLLMLSSNQFVVTRITKTILAHGGHPIQLDAPDQLLTFVDHYFPLLIFVDLDLVERIMGDRWVTTIRQLKARPHTQHISVHLFVELLHTTRQHQFEESGAEHLWERAKLMESVDRVVNHVINPPVWYPDGWKDTPSEAARRGILELNRGDYFEQHEYLEEAWIAEERPIRILYQGILQVGLAFLQIERKNWAGAIKMFRRGLPKLRTLPEISMGIKLADFRTEAERIHLELTQRGPDYLNTLSAKDFPIIEIHNE
ncbi:DUF309 domain-containing protein [Chloroflexi bacterium TSY]|nr:DUF309 domain-containing protein [Chloroflexi bacterium TSY]